MTSLISVILSVVIALCGAGGLEAVPQTAYQVTVSDMCLTCDGEDYALTPELVLTEAIGSEYAAQTISVKTQDDVLFPLSASIDADAIRFSVGDHVYVIDDEVLAEAINCDADTVSEIGTLISSMFTSQHSEVKITADDIDAAFEAFASVCEPNGEKGEITIAGKTCETVCGSCAPSFATLGSVIDAFMANNVCNTAETFALGLAMGNLAVETECASYEELLHVLLGDIAVRSLGVNLCSEFARNEDGCYFNLLFYTDDDAVTGSFIFLREEDDCDLELHIGAQQGSLEGSVLLETHLNDIDTDTPSMAYSFFVDFPTSYSVEYSEDGDEQGYTCINETKISLEYNTAYENGLKNVDADFSIASETHDEAGEKVEYTEYVDYNFGVSIDYKQEAAEAGDVDADCMIGVSMGDHSYALSYKLAKTEVPFDAAALYEGKEEIVLCEDRSHDCYTELSTDMLSLLVDVAGLLEDESVSNLVALVSEMNADYDMAGEGADFMADELFEGLDDSFEVIEAEDFEEFEEFEDFDAFTEAYSDDGYITVTAEEGMEMFAGKKVSFTPPEGYVPDVENTYISSDNCLLIITYVTEDGSDYIQLYLNGYDGYDMDTFLLGEENTITALEQPVVTLGGLDGMYGSVTFEYEGTGINIYFGLEKNLDEVKAILADLAL